MKASDIALVVFIAVLSAGIAFWLSNMLVGNPDELYERIDFASEISSSVAEPSDDVFNPYAKNPTVEVMTPSDCEAWQEWDEVTGACVEKAEPEGEDAENSEDNPEEDGQSPETE